jgi:hypothetical protein
MPPPAADAKAAAPVVGVRHWLCPMTPNCHPHTERGDYADSAASCCREDRIMKKVLAVAALAGASILALAGPSEAVVCKTVGVPKGCVAARPAAHPPAAVVRRPVVR